MLDSMLSAGYKKAVYPWSEWLKQHLPDKESVKLRPMSIHLIVNTSDTPSSLKHQVFSGSVLKGELVKIKTTFDIAFVKIDDMSKAKVLVSGIFVDDRNNVHLLSRTFEFANEAWVELKQANKGNHKQK